MRKVTPIIALSKFYSYKKSTAKNKIFSSIIVILYLLPFNLYAKNLPNKFASWSVFSDKIDNKKICYALSLPINEDGNYKKREQPYFLVINSAKNVNEITVSTGYFYKANSKVELFFDNRKFNNLTYKNFAWANNNQEDGEIITQMQQNLDFTVLGLDEENKYSKDQYSLIGFNQAFRAMKAMCSEIQ